MLCLFALPLDYHLNVFKWLFTMLCDCILCSMLLTSGVWKMFCSEFTGLKTPESPHKIKIVQMPEVLLRFCFSGHAVKKKQIKIRITWDFLDWRIRERALWCVVAGNHSVGVAQPVWKANGSFWGYEPLSLFYETSTWGAVEEFGGDCGSQNPQRRGQI